LMCKEFKENQTLKNVLAETEGFEPSIRLLAV
jgi:hypothetical protein